MKASDLERPYVVEESDIKLFTETLLEGVERKQGK